MNIPNIEEFIPIKFKILSSLGYRVEWTIPRKEGEGDFIDGFHKESENQFHPDLENYFDQLTVPVAAFLDIPDEGLTIYQVEISGKIGDEAAKFSCKLRHKNNQKTDIKTPFIKLKETTFGCESKMWSILENIKNESYEYVFNDKYAQGTLFQKGDIEEA